MSPFLPLYFHLLFIHFLFGDGGLLPHPVVLHGSEGNIPGGLLNPLLSEDEHIIVDSNLPYFERFDGALCYNIYVFIFGSNKELDGDNARLCVGIESGWLKGSSFTFRLYQSMKHTHTNLHTYSKTYQTIQGKQYVSHRIANRPFD